MASYRVSFTTIRRTIVIWCTASMPIKVGSELLHHSHSARRQEAYFFSIQMSTKTIFKCSEKVGLTRAIGAKNNRESLIEREASAKSSIVSANACSYLYRKIHKQSS